MMHLHGVDGRGAVGAGGDDGKFAVPPEELLQAVEHDWMVVGQHEADRDSGHRTARS